MQLPPNLSLSPAIYAQADQEPSPPHNRDKRAVDSVHVSFRAQDTDGPAFMAPAPDAFESDEVYYMDPLPTSIFSPVNSPPTPTFFPAKSPATPTFSPTNSGQFFKERLMDKVYMPAHAQGIGTQVNAIGLHTMNNSDDTTGTGFVRPIGPRGTT